MTTHVRLVSTIDVATVPRSLNAALNWAFDEGNWRNALPSDVLARELLPRIRKAWDALRWHDDGTYFAASKVARELMYACQERPDARLVVE